MNVKIKYKKISFIHLFAGMITLATTVAHTSFIEVISEADSGPGTLRQAILDANISGDSILFASNISLIKLITPLPTIANNITIDALASIVNGKFVPGNCDSLPSPVCTPDNFSAALPVTIDGSLIALSEVDSGIGLRVTNDAVVVGLKFQNFTGSSEYPDAIGILGGTGTATLTVECCMVENIRCMNNQNGTSRAIGIENATTISNCYVKNITSSPLNLDITPNISQTSSAFGILNQTLVQNTRIECVNSGDILANSEETFDSLELSIGSAIGITNELMVEGSRLPQKDCIFAPDNTITIKNSYINHIHGGSISSQLNTQDILLNTVAGIYLENQPNNTIESCRICDIQTGSITATHEAGPENKIQSNGLFGIFIRTDSGSSCIQNNTIESIVHGSSNINIENSNTNLALPIGISAFALPLVIENNTVSSIFGGKHTTTGVNSTLRARSAKLDSSITPGSSGIVAEQSGSRFNLKNTKNSTYCATPSDLADPFIVICKNNIRSVSGPQLIAGGEASIITCSGSVGIASASSAKIVSTNNVINTILGPSLFATKPDSESILDFGSKAIVAAADECELCYNTISSVQEGKITTLFDSSHISYERFLFFETTMSPPALLSGSSAPAQTVGVAHQVLNATSTYTIEHNIIKTIAGSKPLGLGVISAGVGIGIRTTIPEALTRQHPNNRITTKQCGSFLVENTITNNTIYNINSHQSRPAYGIFSEQFFGKQSLIIADNSITTINGGGAALLEEDSNGSVEMIFLPSILPYEPTSGIYLLDSDCTAVLNNTIQTVCAPDSQARGITTTASSDIEITENSISKIKGLGIFVGGAPVPIGSNIPLEFEVISASVRNAIHTNKTFDNTAKGIELGVSNWDNTYEFFEFSEGTNTVDTETIIGNHDQVAPKIKRVLCNSNGTTTIDITLANPEHPNSDFIVQFFRNSTNTVPHGEQPISPFNENFAFTTDENGVARARFVFVPVHKINNSDIISAHVTLILDGSEDIGDTSEFAIQNLNKQSQLGCVTSCNTSKERTSCLSNILFGRK